jgi:hypothetical protein
VGWQHGGMLISFAYRLTREILRSLDDLSNGDYFNTRV